MQQQNKTHIRLGRFNTLQIVKAVDFGLYLDGGETIGEILLPQRYVPAGAKIGDMLNVFIYLDQEERIIATTETPLAQVGDFAWLEVAWVNNYGAFLHWGPMKDLFVPFSEQKMKMQKGQSYIVHLHIDPSSYRIVASAKVERYLSDTMPPYREGDEAEILVWQKTDLGFKVIVDNRFGGMIYDNEIFQPIRTGHKLKAIVRRVYNDGKIDLCLQPHGRAYVEDFATTLLDYIIAHNGHCPLGDKSPAETIYSTFGVSKKVFKKAVGDLYRRHIITIEEDGLRVK